jgi:hypothetical protein
MSIGRILRKMFLGFLLGRRSLFGISMSSEKIEELLYTSHQPRAEQTTADKDGNESKSKMQAQ